MALKMVLWRLFVWAIKGVQVTSHKYQRIYSVTKKDNFLSFPLKQLSEWRHLVATDKGHLLGCLVGSIVLTTLTCICYYLQIFK